MYDVMLYCFGVNTKGVSEWSAMCNKHPPSPGSTSAVVIMGRTTTTGRPNLRFAQDFTETYVKQVGPGCS